MDEQMNETPRVWWWTLALWNAQSLWWAFDHWLVTRLFRLHFCPSCSGYFREACMTLPDKCGACYARDYGIPVGCPCCGGQGTVGDGGYVACPVCGAGDANRRTRLT